MFLSHESSSNAEEPDAEISNESLAEDDAIVVTSQHPAESEEDISPGLDLEAPDSSASDEEPAGPHRALLEEESINDRDGVGRVSISDPECEEFVTEEMGDENLNLHLSDTDEDLPFQGSLTATDRISTGDGPAPGVIVEKTVGDTVAEAQSQRTSEEIADENVDASEDNLAPAGHARIESAQSPVADPDDSKSVLADLALPRVVVNLKLAACRDETLPESEPTDCKVENSPAAPVTVADDLPDVAQETKVFEMTEHSKAAASVDDAALEPEETVGCDEKTADEKPLVEGLCLDSKPSARFIIESVRYLILPGPTQRLSGGAQQRSSCTISEFTRGDRSRLRLR